LNIEVAYDFRKHGYTERNYISDPDEWSNLFHWKGPPDRWRVHFPTAPDADETALTRPDALQARLQRFLPIGKAFDIVGSNLYVVHQRVAKKFRAGRAVLAGDSAHVNSPIGAMGMNSGIHDAFNLAEKLVSILRRGGGRGHSRPLRASAPPRRLAAHAGADHAQQAVADGEGPRPCAGRTTTSCAGPPKTPSLRGAFLLRSSLIEEPA
jgi:3-(3-hydroxy-phenyl)propionate hydroxylase